MSLTNSMLVVDGNAVGGDTEDLTAYQTKADNSLQTTAKTVVGGINEINSNFTTLSGTITANEGITITSYILKKSVNVVFLEMLVQFTPTLDSNNQIGIIESGYRPSGKVFCNCENDSRGKLVKAFVDMHGAIYIVPTSDDSAAVAQNYYLNCTFIVS